MSEADTTLLGGAAQDLGLGATATAVVTWLWAGGGWHWIPAVLVACLGVYTLVLERTLPWQGTLWKDLEQLNQGTGKHPALRKQIRRALDGMLWNGLAQAGGPSPQGTPPGASRWIKSMTYANQRLDRWMGRTIWSYLAFDRLLVVAVLYPMLLLLTLWWWTGFGRLGSTEILPSLGSGLSAWGWRTGVMALALWPLACLALLRRRHSQPSFKPHWWPVATFIVAGWIPIFVSIEVLRGLDLEAAAGAAAIGSAGAGAVASAIALRFVGAGAGAVAITGAGAGVSIGLSASAGTVAGLGAIAGAIAIGIVVQRTRLKAAQTTGPSGLLSVWVLICGLGAYLAMATVVPRGLTFFGLPAATLSGRHPLLLFALGWMPLINAFFDWLSLGITRELLRRMIRSPAWMWAGVVLDVLAGVLLTLGLMWLAFQVLAYLQWCGWPVDAQAMRAAFIADPFDPQVSWLAMLAVTNLLPTLWQLGVCLWGLVDRQFTTSVSLKDSLIQLHDFMDEAGHPKPGAAPPTQGALQLQTVYHSLFVHPWLYAGTVVAVVVGFWGSYVQALRWTLTWLP